MNELSEIDWLLIFVIFAAVVVGLFIHTEALTLVIAAAAVAGVFINREAARRSREGQRSDLFLSLRDRYLATRLNIPNYAFSETRPLPEGDPARIHMQHYWYNAFDEWYATNRLNDGKYRDLWEDYFAPATQSTLRCVAMMNELAEMLKGGASLGAHRDAFLSELKKLYLATGAAKDEEMKKAAAKLFGNIPDGSAPP